jgi:hypothetical protein
LKSATYKVYCLGSKIIFFSGAPVPQAMIPGFIPPHQQVGIFPFPNNQIPEMQQQLQHHQQQQEAATKDVESQRVS